jgi:hypothetical protein
MFFLVAVPLVTDFSSHKFLNFLPSDVDVLLSSVTFCDERTEHTLSYRRVKRSTQATRVSH